MRKVIVKVAVALLVLSQECYIIHHIKCDNNNQEITRATKEVIKEITSIEQDSSSLFTKDGLEVRSQKSNAVELLDIKSTESILEFECLVDVEMLKSQIQALACDTVSLYYGQPSSIEIKEGNVIMILSLIEKVQ